jgi:hypothetical protein
MADILQHMQNVISREQQMGPTLDKITPTTMVMYIDDGNIWVSSDSLITNTHILQAAYNVVSRQLTKSRRSIDIDTLNTTQTPEIY